MINQTRPLSSTAPWFSSVVHVSIVGATAVDRGQNVHADQSAALKTHMQQPAMHCFFFLTPLI